MSNDEVPVAPKGRKNEHLVLMARLCLVDPWGPDRSGFSS